MKTLLPVLGVALFLVANAQGQPQSPGFYFPQQPQPPQNSNSGTGEFLGNYFNDNLNLPSISASSQPAFSSPSPPNRFQFQPQQPQTFSSGPPQQSFGGGFTNSNPVQNYITSSPPTNNIPRETHFFGNNYDFFKSFHLDAAPHRPSSSPFQPIHAYRPSFNSNVGNNNQQTSTTAVTARPTAPTPVFTTSQFFDNPFSSFSTRPAAPRPTTTYNFINGQPAQNSIYNGYEEAAKQLGVTHGLRVFTTETLRANPTISLANVPQPQEAQEVSTESSSTLATLVDDKRIEDDALTLSPPVSSSLAPTPTTTLSPTTTPPPPPPTIIIRNTGRSVATPIVRSKVISSIATPVNLDGSPIPQKQSPPSVAVVTHSRQPLYTSDASPNTVSGVDAFPGRDNEDDFEQSRPQPQRPVVTPQRPVVTPQRPVVIQQRPVPTPQRPVAVTPRVVVTTREPPRPTPTPTVQTTTQQTRLRTNPPPPPSPASTFSPERSLYNNANQLVPGQLYTNTNGAYQHYYRPGAQQQLPPMRGLEEIEPQIIDFPIRNIPINKMIPVFEQHFQNEEYDPYRRPPSFDTFGPPGGPSTFQPQAPQQPQQQQPQYRPQIRQFNPVSPSPTPSPSAQPHPQFQPQPQPFNRPPLIPQAPVVIVTEAAIPQDLVTPPSTNTLEETVIRVGPKGRLLKKRRKVRPQSQQVPQQRSAANTVTTSEARPTTYRPPVEDEDQNQEQPQPATTYRSRFRFSPTTATTSTTASPNGGEVSQGDKSLIASRLKSVERQIRFRHRNKNS